MKKKELCLSIGGVSILLVFLPTEWELKKNLLVEAIHIYLGGFIVPQKKHPQITICFKEIKGIPFQEKGASTYSLYYKKIATAKYEVYYHISIFELCQLLLLTVIEAIRADGFVLHASGIITKNGAVLFAGHSGGGKSTMIRRLKEKYEPIADDSIIIKKESDHYVCYQTPSIDKEDWIKRTGKKYKLQKLYILKKDTPFEVEKLSSRTLLSLLLPMIWVKKTIEKETVRCCAQFCTLLGGELLSLKRNEHARLAEELPSLL